MVEDVIKNFGEQLEYEPVIENNGSFGKSDKFIVCGMGGSNLAAGIIRSWKSKLDIVIHRDYGLSEMEEAEFKKYLVICSSYSGNTEETISSFREALSMKLPLIAITTGGKLLELSREHQVPYIQIPRVDSSSRLAIGYNIKAILKAMGEETTLADMNGLAGMLDFAGYEKMGKELAEKLENRIPLIYSSGPNAGVARYWKISFNETAKLPAFYNFLPELNHNEMIGFNSRIFDGKLNRKFTFIFLTDPDDLPQIQKRSTTTQKLLKDMGFEVLSFDLAGPSLWHKSFAGILTAMWASFYLAKQYGVDPEDISMIEEFKKALAP